MKTQALLLMIGLALLTAGCTDSNRESNARLQASNDSLRAIVASKSTEIEEALTLFNEIQDGFSEINKAQNRIAMSRVSEGANTHTTRLQIKEDMQNILSTMKDNQDRITRLQSTIHKQGVVSKALEKALASAQAELKAATAQIELLQAELQRRDIIIEGMDESINELNVGIEYLNTQNDAKTKTISTQDKTIHTAYFAIGTQRELKEMDILDKGELLKGNYKKDYFTSVDIRSCNSIALMSKRAQLLTNHPESSYTLSKGTDNLLTLKILNTERFWSVSKYLVVRVW